MSYYPQREATVPPAEPAKAEEAQAAEKKEEPKPEGKKAKSEPEPAPELESGSKGIYSTVDFVDFASDFASDS